ncbi:ABC transporter ATP-binding protein [Pseudorhodoferax sp.]|uniref:ABC transporter ATP-binding protein n=1 Tax=Pseudorhodoferax sp. TaxID=1993553 RepID=UPI002DD6B7FC|nr:ABC transporter ATP-binding protein [Pseudorhodoferax sp.]
MPLLDIDGLEVAYGDAVALHGVSLRIEAGTITSVLGANGAGKTTLLRTISGLQRARRGSVRYDGQPIGGLPVHRIVRAGIAHVPEGRGVLAELSVLDNLRLGAYAQPAATQAAALQEVHALFPVLRERQHQAAGMLSGGEQQMLAIGRALLARPRLLMVDELSLGLAPIVTRTLMQLLERIKARGVTILLVEQSIHQALRISDRVYILANGGLAFDGTPQALAAREDLMHAYLGAAAPAFT